MSETNSQWTLITPPRCDACDSIATWKHPLGGLRCNTCPRPEVKRFGVFDMYRRSWWPRSFDTFDEAQAHYDRCKGPGSRGEVRELPER
jgi:hypothetical protein